MLKATRFAGLALGLAGPALAEEPPVPPLPALNLDPASISVLGVSSGGYMATQLAVAFPERIQGLGVFAAGPWGCAQGRLSQALTRCMSSSQGSPHDRAPPDAEALAERLAGYRDQGLVGDAEALARQRVFLWHGTQDATVAPALGDALAAQYRDWLDAPARQLDSRQAEGAGHGWPVSSPEASARAADCGEGGSPYLLACGIDGADQALGWLYPAREAAGDNAGTEGNEKTSAEGNEASSGELREFDQAPFGGGLDERGYLYVPETCAAGTRCGLAVALHGCRMGATQAGETFVRHSGLNAWAAAHRLAVLYPQVGPSLPNPQGCWDWWGYEESTWQPRPHHDTRDGEQVAAIMAMIETLAGSTASDAETP